MLLSERSGALAAGADGYRVLGEFAVPSRQGNERAAMEKVAGVIEALNLPARPAGATQDGRS